MLWHVPAYEHVQLHLRQEDKRILCPTQLGARKSLLAESPAQGCGFGLLVFKVKKFQWSLGEFFRTSLLSMIVRVRVEVSRKQKAEGRTSLDGSSSFVGQMLA